MDAAREVALSLPRSYEALVGGRVKFRVGRIVYLALSRHEALMGFAFPKELREPLIRSDPGKFVMPRPSDQRYSWVLVRLAAIDETEMRALVIDAWAMVVPKRAAAAHVDKLRRSTIDPASSTRATGRCSDAPAANAANPAQINR